MAGTDLLLFAEDPSAANYAALLLPALARRGWNARLYASAVACGWLREQGIAHIPAADGTDARSLLLAVAPRCVLTGTAENPETLGLELIDAARTLGIPSAAFVDALMSAPYRFRGRSADALAHAPDWLLVPDRATEEAFAGLGYPIGCIAVCGHPQYDRTLELAAQWESAGGPAAFRARVFPEVAPQRKILTFVSEGALRYALLPRHGLADYGFSGRGIDKGRTKIVLEEVLDAVAAMAEEPYVVFRVHPIESPGDYGEYRGEIDQFSSGGSPLELVYASDLTVGMTSMLLLEAALLGRPTLAALARESELELLPSVRAGVTRQVMNRAALRRELPGLLSGGGAAAARSRADWVVAGAAERVVRVIAKLI